MRNLTMGVGRCNSQNYSRPSITESNVFPVYGGLRTDQRSIVQMGTCHSLGGQNGAEASIDVTKHRHALHMLEST